MVSNVCNYKVLEEKPNAWRTLSEREWVNCRLGFLFYFINGVINNTEEDNHALNDYSHPIGTITMDKIRDRTVPYSE